MMDDRFDDAIRDAAEEYNRPPETPREIMWARIEAVRRERARQRDRLRLLYTPWVRWSVGIAAALAIGIGIGRFSFTDGPDMPPVAVAPDVATPAEGGTSGVAYRQAATEHLTQADAFLTAFRANPEVRGGAGGAGGAGGDPGSWASVGELLSSTRLLMDSPAAEDPVLRSLLEDLELVLAQIAQLTQERGSSEIDLVNQGIERRGLLLKLRSVIPAGPSAVGIQGEV